MDWNGSFCFRSDEARPDGTGHVAPVCLNELLQAHRGLIIEGTTMSTMATDPAKTFHELVGDIVRNARKSPDPH
jgi:hypothetical protein